MFVYLSLYSGFTVMRQTPQFIETKTFEFASSRRTLQYAIHQLVKKVSTEKFVLGCRHHLAEFSSHRQERIKGNSTPRPRERFSRSTLLSWTVEIRNASPPRTDRANENETPFAIPVNSPQTERPVGGGGGYTSRRTIVQHIHGLHLCMCRTLKTEITPRCPTGEAAGNDFSGRSPSLFSS